MASGKDTGVLNIWTYAIKINLRMVPKLVAYKTISQKVSLLHRVTLKILWKKCCSTIILCTQEINLFLQHNCTQNITLRDLRGSVQCPVRLGIVYLWYIPEIPSQKNCSSTFFLESKKWDLPPCFSWALLLLRFTYCVPSGVSFFLFPGSHIMSVLAFLVRVLESALRRTNEFSYSWWTKEIGSYASFCVAWGPNSEHIVPCHNRNLTKQTKAKIDGFLSVSRENDQQYEIEVSFFLSQAPSELFSLI